MTKFEAELLKEVKVNEFTMRVYEADPYYHVVVSKNGKHFDDEMVSNLGEELEILKRKYERI